MSRQCAGITREGRRCTVPVDGAQEFCHLHDPARAEQRRRAARRAGKAKPASREVRVLKEEIRDLIADVRSGELDRNDAAVMVQAYRALKDFITLERQVKETEELLARVEALEQAQGKRAPWGA